MPISIKTKSLKYKDPVTGQYKAIDAVGQQLTWLAQAYAKGTKKGDPVVNGQQGWHDNSKYYATLAKQYMERAEAAVQRDTTDIDQALIQIQSTLNEKIDRIVLRGLRLQFYSGNNEVGYCQLADRSITYEKLSTSVQNAISKMDTAMTIDVYDPLGLGQGELGVDPYTYSDNQNNTLKAQLLSTDTYTIDGVAYTGLRGALTGILARAKEYGDGLVETGTYIVDNDTYTGLEAALQGILQKAKNYADAKDLDLLNHHVYTINGTSYTGLMTALVGILNKANTYTDETFSSKTYTIEGSSYTGVIAALQGILNKSKDYVNARIDAYVPYSISIVSSLPTVGADRTFYLIKKEDGNYEKWWYIDDGTGTKVWDQFGGGSSTKVVNSLPPAIEADADIDYILKTSAGYIYYKWIDNKWEMIAGSLASVVSALPDVSEGNEYTDYYVENDGNYIHYRFKDNKFIQVGSAEDSYSTAEIDSKFSTLTNKVNTNEGNITSATQRLGSLANQVTTLRQTVEGLDTANYDYKATYQTETIDDQQVDNVYRLYKLPSGTDIEDGQGTVVSEFVIQGGGGGGGTAASTLTVRRITPSPYVVTKDDQILLQFEYSSVNSDNEDVPGTYAWRIGNRTIATGNCVKGVNTFDITDYITTIGITRVTLEVSDEGHSSTTKSYTIQKVDLYIESSFNQKNYAALNTPIRFRYIPHGNVAKTVHFKLDGVETTEDTTTSNETLEHIVAAQEYGTYLLEVWMTATINNTLIETNHIYKDLIWYDPDEDEQQPVISCIYRNDYYGNVKIKQYDVLPITFYVYDPITFSPKVKKYINDVYIDEDKIENNEGIWNFQTGQIGIHTLRLECRETSITIKVEVEKLNIDVDPVTSGLQIDFNPVGISNTSENRIWSNENYHMTVSDNFDWAGGGYQTDNSGDSYFLIRAGSYVTFDYNMFEGNTENNITTKDGAEMKICFMVENVQDVNAIWLSNVETTTTTVHDATLDADVTKTVNLGLQMSAHEAWLKTNKARSSEEGDTSEGVAASNTYLYMPYSEEDIIEMDINIDPISGGNNPTGFTLSYEDGVPSKAYIYDSVDRFYQQNPKPIKIGSEKCDIRIYRLKIYSRSLNTTEIMRNFIADSRNSTTMLARYNKNSIYYDSENQIYTPYKDKGILDPERLAIRVPNVKILMLETDHFTTSKKTFVKSSLRCIHAPGGDIYPGDEYEDNWYFENGYHAGQGTTSDNYGQSGRNVDFLFNCDGVHKPSDKVEAEAGYVSRLTKGYLTDAATTQTCSDWKGNDCKVSLTRTSVPNNFFNLKVNIASSENVNNWLLQKRYNDFLPYISPAKQRDNRIKNDMEFVPAILFIKETNTETITENGQLKYSQHTEFNDTNWHFYALGNIGDSKKTDYTRSYDPTDKNEFTIEISDNTKNNATFQSGVYKQNGTLKCETFHREKSLDSEGKLVVINVPDVLVDKYEYPVPAAQANNLLYKIGPIRVINNTGDPQYDGDETGYINYRMWCLYNEGFDGDHSFEPRYACCGDYRDGKLVNDTGNGGKPQVAKNNEVWRAFYKWVITSTDAQFRNELDQWCVRSAVEFFYAFTHYYTMMDNRAKNTFWHFAKTGEYRQVSRPVPELLHIYCELINDEYVTTTDTQINNNKTYYTQYAFDLWDYDNDTALGINNNGQLIFPYGKEDTDYNIDGDPASGWIFNGADSVFWCRLRDLLSSEIASTFNTVSNECFNANNLINQFDTRQECYPEEIWRLDIERKYLRTFTGNSVDNSITKGKQNSQFLRDMMQGRKKYQRRQWVRDQEMYFGTKYLINNVTGDSNRITFRCYNPGVNAVIPPDYTLKITPATDMYVSAMFGNGDTTQVRAKANQQVELKFSVSTATDTQVTIYGANRIAALNDLSACYITAPNFSNAVRLKKLVLGNTTEGYNNARLQSIQLNNNQMLQELDLRNCKALAGGLNLSNSINLLRLYAENTQLASVTFARNGKLQLAHLPNTIETLVMRGLNNLTDFECSLIYLYSLTLEGGNLNNQELIQDTLDTLQELRLYNIEWTLENTDLLKEIYKLSYSLISGEATILSELGSREPATYAEKWPDLVLIPAGGVRQEYEVTFVNDDKDHTVLYTEIYEQGAYLEDPVYTEKIEEPTKQKDQQYTYSFGSYDSAGAYIEWSGWKLKSSNGTEITGNDIRNVQVAGNLTVTAVYEAYTRSYTVNFYTKQGDETPIYSQKAVQYGSGVEYNTFPGSRKDEEGLLHYYAFKGWNILTSQITDDTNVYGVWEELNSVPSQGKEMHELTPLELYAVARSNSQTIHGWEDKDYFNLELGHDFDFQNVNSIQLGKDITFSNIKRDTFAGNNGYYFDGYLRTGVATTEIKPFSKDKGAFTIAIDFQFGEKVANTDDYEVLLSCFEKNPNYGTTGNESEFLRTGFRILRNANSNYVYLQIGGGDQTLRTIGYAHSRDIVVLRYNPNSKYRSGSDGNYHYDFHLYSSFNQNQTSDGYNFTVTYDTSPSIYTSGGFNITNFIKSEAPLIFGGQFEGLDSNSSPVFSHLSRATIHWLKIWEDDLGDINSRLLAQWPHEKIRMEYYGSGRYQYQGVSTTGNTTKGSWISATALGTAFPKTFSYYNHYNYYGNTYYYNYTTYYNFFNKRLLQSLSWVWRSILAQAAVKYGSSFSTSGSVSTVYNSLYLPAYKQVYLTASGSQYSNEISPATSGISWMRNDKNRIRFSNFIIQNIDSRQIIQESNEPTSLYQTALEPGSIWHDTYNNRYYLLVEGTIVQQYDLTALPDTRDVDPAYMRSGLWVPAISYPTRSTYSSSRYHRYVNAGGSLTYINDYYNISRAGIVFEISI